MEREKDLTHENNFGAISKTPFRSDKKNVMTGVRMQLQGACMRREGGRREQCVFLWLFVGIW